MYCDPMKARLTLSNSVVITVKYASYDLVSLLNDDSKPSIRNTSGSLNTEVLIAASTTSFGVFLPRSEA